MVFFTVVFIAQCHAFLESILTSSLEDSQSVLERREGPRFSLSCFEHTPLALPSKSLEIGLNEEI